MARASPKKQPAQDLAPFATSALSKVLGEVSAQKMLRERQAAVATAVPADAGAPEEVPLRSPPPSRRRRLPSYASPPLFSRKGLGAEEEKGGASKHPPPVGVRRARQNSQYSKGGSVREGTGVGISTPSGPVGRVREGVVGGRVRSKVCTGAYVEEVRPRVVRGGRKVAGGGKGGG